MQNQSLCAPYVKSEFEHVNYTTRHKCVTDLLSTTATTINHQGSKLPKLQAMDWKESFKQGIEHFKQKQYESALESLNTVRNFISSLNYSTNYRWQAIRGNSNEKNLFDSRAAVYEKLGLPWDALKDAKKVIDLAPKWWQVSWFDAAFVLCDSH